MERRLGSVIKGFVFDLDGTLVDSKIDFTTMKSELGLNAGDDVLAHVELLTSTERQRALDIIYRHERLGAEDAVCIEGAKEFIDRARIEKKPCAIFTRNARSLAELSLKNYGFEVELIVAREDAPPKPKPDGLQMIARSFGMGLREMLFVGDYIYDLQAGLAAGVPTALYLPAPADFETQGADFLFSSYQQLADRYLGR